MNKTELKAIGYYFGFSNLGMHADEVLAKWAKRTPGNWDKLISDIDREIGMSAEGSDEMYEGMLDEVRHWVKDVAKPDAFTCRVWNEKAKKYGFETSLPENV